MRFKVDWAGLIVGRKFNIFALFSFEFESNFPSTSPPPGGGASIKGGIFALRVWGAYIWRGLFSKIMKYGEGSVQPTLR